MSENNEQYTSPFFPDGDSPLQQGDSTELYSNSDNEFDLNSLANHPNEEENKPQNGSPRRRKSSKKAKKKKGLVKSLLTVFLILVITFCLVVGSFIVYIFAFVDNTIYEDLNDLTLNYTTTIYVKQPGSQDYTEYQRLHGGENRIWKGLESIPVNLQNAFIDIEDQRFKSHNGVDWKRTVSAFANMFVHMYSSNQGGSTITQQLVKNLTGDNQQSPMRKIREIMRAQELEAKYSKEVILECYLNTVTFANGIGGVEVASNYYFNKTVSDLSLEECACLAAIVKAPETYRPDKFPENNADRRKLVLKKMLDLGHITKEEYEKSVNAEVKIVASKANINEVETNSYFVDALIDNVVDGLVAEYGYDRTYAEQNFYNGGYKIYCTLDTDIQKAIDEVYTDSKYFSKSRKGQTAQSAFTLMDYNGHVLGICGGSGKKTTNRGLNRATSSPRSPGSTMKPIASYSLALDNNLITYSTIFKDQPIKLADGKSWPPNWYGYYGGSMTVAKALERSVNTVPAQLVQQQSIQSVYDHLTKDMGITTLVPNANADLTYSSMALGSCYKGITTLESCAAFATFGSKGKYYKPTFYTKVMDQHDELILNGEPDSKIAMSEDTAVVMNHLLRNVVDGSQGTGKAIRSYLSKMPIYAKTGTTNDNENCWFVGGTPYYIASCWYGYDTPETVRNANGASKIWGNIMSKIHKNLEVKQFEESSYVTCRRYCTSTGLLATNACGSTGIGWYKTSHLPTCTKHRGEILDAVDTTSKAETSTSSKSSSAATSSAAAQTSSKATSSQKASSAAPASSSKPQASSKPASSAAAVSSGGNN